MYDLFQCVRPSKCFVEGDLMLMNAMRGDALCCEKEAAVVRLSSACEGASGTCCCLIPHFTLPEAPLWLQLHHAARDRPGTAAPRPSKPAVPQLTINEGLRA